MSSNVGEAAAAAHRTTVESSTADIAAFLQEAFGQKLVAFMAGVEDPKTVGRWANGTRSPRDHETEQRLLDAHQVFRMLVAQESPHTVRAWFIGRNPQLDDEAPAMAIREGRTKDVMVAARAFLTGG